MKRMLTALFVTATLFTAVAQEKAPANPVPPTPAPQTTTTATPGILTQAPAPTPAPTPDPNQWKRPLKDIKFREF